MVDGAVVLRERWHQQGHSGPEIRDDGRRQEVEHHQVLQTLTDPSVAQQLEAAKVHRGNGEKGGRVPLGFAANRGTLVVDVQRLNFTVGGFKRGTRRRRPSPLRDGSRDR